MEVHLYLSLLLDALKNRLHLCLVVTESSVRHYDPRRESDRGAVLNTFCH